MLPVAILAGGLAMRLRPLTEEVPKALLPVDGEPFLAHQLRLLKAAGIERVVLCVGYLGERIREFVGDGARFGMSVECCFDGPAPLGTAGAVKMALPRLGPRFFVLYGDSFLPCDYRAVMDAFESSGKQALMTVYRNEGRWDASNIQFADGRILAYDKRNPSSLMRHIDYGLGVFRDSAFAAVSGSEPHDLAALYQELLRGGELAGLEVGERFYEIGSAEGLRELSAWLARRATSGSE